MFQNLLFDLDGTLTNSADGITKCVQYALRAQNIEEPDLKSWRFSSARPCATALSNTTA